MIFHNRRLFRNTISGHLFIRTFLSLVMLSVVPLLCISLLFSYMAEQFWKSESYSSNQRALTQYMNVVDNRVAFAMEESIRLATDHSVISFILNPTFADISRNTHIMKSLSDIKKADNGVNHAYLYSNFNKLILDSDNKGYRYHDFYDQEALRYYGKGGRSPIIIRYKEQAPRQIGECLTVYQTVPLDSKDDLGCLILNVEKEFLFSYEELPSVLNMTVYNQEGVCLSSPWESQPDYQREPEFRKQLKNTAASFTYKADGQNMVVIHAVSPISGWSFIGTAPLPVFFSQYHSISNLLFGLAAAALIISFLASFFMAYQLYRPVKTLVNVISGSTVVPQQKLSGAYRYIQEAYHTIITENDSMTTLVAQMKPAVKCNFFFNLLLGEKISREEAAHKLDFFNEGFSASGYVTVLLSLADYDTYIQTYNEHAQLLHSCELQEMISHHTAHCPQAFFKINRFSWALVLNTGDSSILSDSAARLQTAVNLLPFTILVETGTIYSSPLDIPYSYHEALDKLKFQKYSESINSRHPSALPSYHLNTKLEEALLQAVRVGSVSATEHSCIQIFQNMKESGAAYSDMLQTASHLMNQILEILIILGIDTGSIQKSADITPIPSGTPEPDHLQAHLLDTALSASRRIKEYNKERTGQNIERILEYINSHLGDDISLQDLADICQISPSYVSRLFKDRLNVGFVEYMNTLRVTRAKKLLEETRINVEQVGFQVGFNHVRSFIRTFKQYTGVTPGQYRSVQSAYKTGTIKKATNPAPSEPAVDEPDNARFK